MPVGTAIAGSPSTGIAISVADWRQTSIVRSALSTSNPCAYGNSVHTGASTSGVRSRNAYQSRISRVRSASAFKWASTPRSGMLSTIELHRSAHAVVAVAIEVGLHEAAEFRDEHLEPQLERAGESGRLVGHDLVTGIGQRSSRPAPAPAATGADGATPPKSAASVTTRHADRRLPSARLPAARAPTTDRARRRGHGVEPSAHVAHRTRQRPLHRHQLCGDDAFGFAARVVRGHAAERRPQAREPGAVRGIAHRTGDVVAMRERRDAGGHRRRRAAARAARRHVARPRAVRASAKIVHRVEPEAECRRIGAADDDRRPLFSSWRPPDCRRRQ